MKILAFTFLLISTASCQTTADSNYELNRRSGLSIGKDLGDKSYNTKPDDEIEKVETTSISSSDQMSPTLKAPVVKKVWVKSQQISETSWLQGTWLYLQVEKAKWVSPKKKGK